MKKLNKFKKIAIDARMIEMSGIGTYIQNIINSGIYSVAIGNADIIHKYSPNIEVIEFNAKIHSLEEKFHYPTRVIKEKKIDCVHFPHFNIPLFFNKHFIVTVHDLIQLVHPEFFPNKFAKYYWKFFINLACKKSDIVFTVSENSKQDLVKYFGIKSEKVFVTYNAVNLNNFKKLPNSQFNNLYLKFNLPVGKKIVLFVGNLKAHKNLTRLMEAFTKIHNYNNSVLVLVGNAFKDLNITEVENKYKLTGHLIVTGKVSEDELIGFYNISDVFAFPSIYEGFGIPPLEAMACGTPVISSNSSCLPEILGDGVLYFNPYNVNEISDCINKVLNNVDLSDKLISAGFNRVKNYSWNNTINKMKEILYS